MLASIPPNSVSYSIFFLSISFWPSIPASPVLSHFPDHDCRLSGPAWSTPAGTTSSAEGGRTTTLAEIDFAAFFDRLSDASDSDAGALLRQDRELLLDKPRFARALERLFLQPEIEVLRASYSNSEFHSTSDSADEAKIGRTRAGRGLDERAPGEPRRCLFGVAFLAAVNYAGCHLMFLANAGMTKNHAFHEEVAGAPGAVTSVWQVRERCRPAKQVLAQTLDLATRDGARNTVLELVYTRWPVLYLLVGFADAARGIIETAELDSWGLFSLERRRNAVTCGSDWKELRAVFNHDGDSTPRAWSENWAEVASDFVFRPEFEEKFSRAAGECVWGSVMASLFKVYLCLQSELCCNKVKLSPWKGPMIHANAPLSSPPPTSSSHLLLPPPTHLPSTSPPPTWPLPPSLHDSCMIHGAAPWDTFHFVTGQWEPSCADEFLPPVEVAVTGALREAPRAMELAAGGEIGSKDQDPQFLCDFECLLGSVWPVFGLLFVLGRQTKKHSFVLDFPVNLLVPENKGSFVSKVLLTMGAGGAARPPNQGLPVSLTQKLLGGPVHGRRPSLFFVTALWGDYYTSLLPRFCGRLRDLLQRDQAGMVDGPTVASLFRHYEAINQVIFAHDEDSHDKCLAGSGCGPSFVCVRGWSQALGKVSLPLLLLNAGHDVLYADFDTFFFRHPALVVVESLFKRAESPLDEGVVDDVDILIGGSLLDTCINSGVFFARSSNRTQAFFQAALEFLYKNPFLVEQKLFSALLGRLDGVVGSAAPHESKEPEEVNRAFAKFVVERGLLDGDGKSALVTWRTVDARRKWAHGIWHGQTPDSLLGKDGDGRHKPIAFHVEGGQWADAAFRRGRSGPGVVENTDSCRSCDEVKEVLEAMYRIYAVVGGDEGGERVGKGASEKIVRSFWESRRIAELPAERMRCRTIPLRKNATGESVIHGHVEL